MSRDSLAEPFRSENVLRPDKGVLWRFVVVALKTLLTASLALLGAASVASTGLAATAFDGAWSVRIVSDPGCDNQYAVSIRIEDGSIKYENLILQAIGSGSVSNRGHLTAQIGEAKVAGNLAKLSGGGKWHSPKCTGTWTASKARI
jgi:hypothetical protein